MHGVTLVEHKYNNTIEYIYADSNNIPLGADVYGIDIGPIISLTKDLDYFNDTLVRFIYCSFFYEVSKSFIKTEPSENIFMNALNLFIECCNGFSGAVINCFYSFWQEQNKQRNEKNMVHFTAPFHLEEAYGALEENELLQNPLYLSTYKPAFIGLIKDLRGTVHKDTFYDVLLKAFSS